ncbi:putative alpha/beta hydrolase [Lachnellula arida]|uniref:Putative alpha/beta hydrolase n=1 Tax=Lachnellula arida TaxID=1316785 RepID=A0A8T9B1R4_9HELO|nr:putative alpha/beta hydrolase [Lachnellula arida]
MMSGSQPAPSAANLAFFGSKVDNTVFAAISRLFTTPFRWNHWNGAPVLYKDVLFAAIRAMLSNLTIAQSRYLNKSTSETYQDFCKAISQEPKTVKLESGTTTAHWIGNKNADVVILFLHGGGYTQPCTPQHMQYFHRLVTDLNKLSDGTPSISVLLLAYTLAPEAQFPIQLKQAVSMLSYLLNEAGKSPMDIMITGDSAGGGLILSLLSHLLHPHPDIPKLSISMPLRAAFLYSPWVSFDTSHDSYTKNDVKDTLVPDILRKWAGSYLGTVDRETDPGVVVGGNNYSEPLLADASWWEGMHNIVKDMWIWAGENEVFLDSLRDFGAKFSDGWKVGGGAEESIKLEFGKNDAHIGPIMDVMLQYKEKSETQLGLEEWLKVRLA